MGDLVVVVDDDADVRELVGSALAGAGFRLALLGDPAEADRLLAAERPALLVVDQRLGPGATGTELAERARAHHPALPVLVVSGQAGLDHGLDPPVAMLDKPFSLSVLAATARRLTDTTPERSGPTRLASPGAGSGPGAATAPNPAARAAGSVGNAGLARAVCDAYEDQLAGIAAHLHDDTIQQLAAATLRVGLARRQPDRTVAEVDAALEEVETALRATSDRLRAEVLVLRPDWLPGATLAESLDVLGPSLAAADVSVDVPGALGDAHVGVPGHRALEALVAELDACAVTGGALRACDDGEVIFLTLEATVVGTASGPSTGLDLLARAELAGGGAERSHSAGRASWVLRLPHRRAP